jgi:hypothetical protein
MSINLRCFEMKEGVIIPNDLPVNNKEDNLMVCENLIDIFKYKDYFDLHCSEQYNNGCGIELEIPTINYTILVYLHKRSSCGIIEFLEYGTTSIKYLYKIPVTEIANSLIKRIQDFGLDAKNATVRDILYECFSEICHVKCPMDVLGYKKYDIRKNTSIDLQTKISYLTTTSSNITVYENHNNETCISEGYFMIYMFGLMILGAIIFCSANHFASYIKRKMKNFHDQRHRTTLRNQRYNLLNIS